MKRFGLLVLGSVLCAAVLAMLLISADNPVWKYDKSRIAVDAVAVPTQPEAEEGRVMAQRIHGTSLVVLQYSGYDGPYVEDGSNEEVSNVASILLHNAGDRMAAYCRVYLKVDGKLQSFSAEMLAPGKTAIVLEENKEPYCDKVPTAYQALVRCKDMEDDLLDWLAVSDVDMGTVNVKNLSGKLLTDTTLTYRTVLQDGAIYLGGNTYCTRIDAVAPGETVTLHPERYTKGYSEFIWAE